MRLDEVVGQFLELLRSPRTVDAYPQAPPLLRAALGDDADVGALRPANLLRWASAEGTCLNADGAKCHPSSANRAQSAALALFGILVRA